jgi:hypothetical protein
LPRESSASRRQGTTPAKIPGVIQVVRIERVEVDLDPHAALVT